MNNVVYKTDESIELDAEEQGAELESHKIIDTSHEEESEDTGTVAHERES